MVTNRFEQWAVVPLTMRPCSLHRGNVMLSMRSNGTCTGSNTSTIHKKCPPDKRDTGHGSCSGAPALFLDFRSFHLLRLSKHLLSCISVNTIRNDIGISCSHSLPRSFISLFPTNIQCIITSTVNEAEKIQSTVRMLNFQYRSHRQPAATITGLLPKSLCSTLCEVLSGSFDTFWNKISKIYEKGHVQNFSINEALELVGHPMVKGCQVR